MGPVAIDPGAPWATGMHLVMVESFASGLLNCQIGDISRGLLARTGERYP